MCHPKEIVGLFADFRMCKNKYETAYNEQSYARKPG